MLIRTSDSAALDFTSGGCIGRVQSCASLTKKSDSKAREKHFNQKLISLTRLSHLVNARLPTIRECLSKSEKKTAGITRMNINHRNHPREKMRVRETILVGYTLGGMSVFATDFYKQSDIFVKVASRHRLRCVYQ